MVSLFSPSTFIMTSNIATQEDITFDHISY
jgi:hypothetical protein